VIDGQPSFGHHLFEIPVTQRIPEIPAHAKDDRLATEVSPSEQCRSGVAHSLNRTRSPQPVCDTTDLTVPASEIVNNLHEAYERLQWSPNSFGIFISGRSKTADIEQSS
jgi:hypothetical protein